jgi:hypothetical protein
MQSWPLCRRVWEEEGDNEGAISNIIDWMSAIPVDGASPVEELASSQGSPGIHRIVVYRRCAFCTVQRLTILFGFVCILIFYKSPSVLNNYGSWYRRDCFEVNLIIGTIE